MIATKSFHVTKLFWLVGARSLLLHSEYPCQNPKQVSQIINFVETSGVMVVPGPLEPHGISCGAMKDLLLYLYTGSSKHLADPVNCLYVLSVSGRAIPIPFNFTDFYGLNSTDHHALLIHCSYNVQNALSTESCLEFYQLSLQLHVPKIEEITIEFILKHYKELADKLPFLPVHIFQKIQVEFNLRLLQLSGGF